VALDGERVWAAVENGLSVDPRRGVNTAVEACGRYAAQAGRLALVVCEPDGSAQRWTYADLDANAARCARVFATAGLRRGDRVAAVLTRQVESLIVALAAWRSGLVYVPLYCGFGSDAMAHRIEVSGASLVVTDGRFRETLARAQSLLSADVHVLTVGDGVSGDRSLWKEIEAAAPDGPQADTAGTDLATLMFTSGTTGSPKACAMPHNALLSLLPFAIHGLDAGPESLLFTTADPGWSYGLYTTGVAPMSLGVARVIYTGDFDPAAWRRVMTEQRVTHLAAAPSAYRRLAAEFASAGTPPGLIGAAAAGEPLPGAVAQAWQATGAPPIHDGYGLSEVGMLLGDLRNPESGTEAGWLSGPIPGFEVVLLDESGDPVRDGEPGRIAVRRPRYQLSNGYENVPDLWTARWSDDLFVTDDLASKAPDGRWRFIGRADDMIITSGFNVSPVEVESVLLQQPGVAEAAVVAAADPAKGTVVRAVIVRDADAPEPDALREQLRAAVKHRVARYAAPRIIDFVDSLPRTEVGKLRRAALRSPT
jgi:acetyl-CoA synthetase